MFVFPFTDELDDIEGSVDAGPVKRSVHRAILKVYVGPILEQELHCRQKTISCSQVQG